MLYILKFLSETGFSEKLMSIQRFTTSHSQTKECIELKSRATPPPLPRPGH